jgi:type II secretion system protein E (GspE)
VQEILESRRCKILSVEDPVEYRLKGVSQVQVNPAEGVRLTFAAALREFLRQDPDVILVGEIRDPESAKSPSKPP